MTDKTFKYRRQDFGDLPIELKHLTIYLNFYEDRVEAENCLEMIAKHTLKEITLDARDLEIQGVFWCRGKR